MERRPDSLEASLRAALAQTSEKAPRPVVRMELPLKLDRLVLPRMLRNLRPASVLVPVMKRKAGLTVLLTRRSEEMPSHKGQISFPGGKRGPGDASAAAAALREAEEEAGIPPASVEVIGYLDDYPTVTRYMVTPVVGLVEDVAQVTACAREVAEIFEVPLPFVLARGNFRQGSLRLKGLKLPYYELNYGAYRIWGATAGMLWNFAEKIGAEDIGGPEQARRKA